MDFRTRNYTADILGEIIIREKTDGIEDVYLIKGEQDSTGNFAVLSSYFLQKRSNKFNRAHRYPIKLSEILNEHDESNNWKYFVDRLDIDLVNELIALRLNALSIYALIIAYPEMRRHLSKPLLLILAANYRKRFDSLAESERKDYRTWVPWLFKADRRLTTGQIRALGRLNCCDAATTILTAVELIIKKFQAINRFLPKTGVIESESIKQLRSLLSKYPELKEANWLSLECVLSQKQKLETEHMYKDTRSMLRFAGVSNPRQTLLKQPKCINDLKGLHDRYVSFKFFNNIEPETPFITRNMKDHPPFKLIRKVGELCRIAVKFNNCAAIYVPKCLKGDMVHWLYKRNDELALLQVTFHGPLKPRVSQFYGPNNSPASATAIQESEYLLQNICTQKTISTP